MKAAFICLWITSAMAALGSLVLADVPLPPAEMREIEESLESGDLTIATLESRTSGEDEGPEWGDLVGQSLAIDGTWAIAGAPGDGAAYLFERSLAGWEKRQKLRPSVPLALGQQFGFAVAISGDTVLVGETFSGRVHPFVRNGATWVAQPPFSTPTAAPRKPQRPGYALLLQGDLALVGQPWTASNQAGEGTVCLFTRNQGSWALSSTIVPSAPFPNDRFGYAAAWENGLLVIGAPGFTDPSPGLHIGKIFVCEQEAGLWVEKQVIQSGAGYGAGLQLSEERLMLKLGETGGTVVFFSRVSGNFVQEAIFSGLSWVGNIAMDGPTAFAAINHPFGQGIYVFNRTGGAWTKSPNLLSSSRQKYQSVAFDSGMLLIGANEYSQDVNWPAPERPLVALDYDAVSSSAVPVIMPEESYANPSDGIGQRVAVSGDYAAVCVPGDTDLSGSFGRVDLYLRGPSGWQLAQQIKSAGSNDLFATAVAMDGNRLLVGGRGAAYLYERLNASWSQVALLPKPPEEDYSEFGGYVGLNGDVAVVSAQSRLALKGNPVIHTYTLDSVGWGYRSTLKSPRPGLGSEGMTVSLSKGYLMMGNPEDGVDGAVSIFRLSGSRWVSETRLLPVKGRKYVGPVAINGAEALITTSAGVEYHMLERGRWRLKQLLVPDAVAHLYGWGKSLAIAGDWVAVTQLPPNEYGRPVEARLKMFARFGQQWLPAETIEGLSADEFGTSVAMDGGNVAVGAPQQPVRTGQGNGSGKAYFYGAMQHSRLTVYDTVFAQSMKLPDGGLLDFSRIQAGTKARRTIQLANEGIRSVGSLSFQITGPNANNFALVQQNPTAIPAGSSRAVEVEFVSPTGNEGLRTATLHIWSNDSTLPHMALSLAAQIVPGEEVITYPVQVEPRFYFTEEPILLAPQVGGAGPFRYQWLKNGKLISGATARALAIRACLKTGGGLIFGSEGVC